MKITKSEIVYDKLKSEIINQEFKLNEALNEQKVAERYNVSKTPVREALNKLVQDGYLLKYPRSGYFVKELKLNEFYEIVQLRFVLESGIAQIIISSCYDEQIRSLYELTKETVVPYEKYNEVNKGFHLAMAELTQNRYIYNMLESIFSQNSRRLSMEYYSSVNGDMHKNHRVLIDRLLERDYQKAVWVLKEELKRTEDSGIRLDFLSGGK